MANIKLANGNSATAMVSINEENYAFPEPSTYSSQTSTIVDGGRNVKGEYLGSVIRWDVAKISLTWKFISVQDWATLLSKFSQPQGGDFVRSITFFLQDTGTWETRNMYVSDRKANVFLRDEVGNIRGYTDVSLSLVEV